MKFIDISWPIEPSMTKYKNNGSIHITPLKSMPHDTSCTSSLLFESHTGTHIDAPAHFLPEGKTIDEMPLSTFIGSCYVIDCTHIIEAITKVDLEPYPLAGKIVLLKTKNSFLLSTEAFNYNFIYLDQKGAEYLVHQNIKAVGIDYLGIERNQKNHETHTILLQKEVGIIEGLRLANVSQGHYFLWCLPLLIKNIEAAPARAILVQE